VVKKLHWWFWFVGLYYAGYVFWTIQNRCFVNFTATDGLVDWKENYLMIIIQNENVDRYFFVNVWN
jgi:hypothetical protein